MQVSLISASSTLLIYDIFSLKLKISVFLVLKLKLTCLLEYSNNLLNHLSFSSLIKYKKLTQLIYLFLPNLFFI